MHKTIRIALADDHQLVLDGLSLLLSGMPEVSVAFTASNGEELLAGLKATSVDLVLTDIDMPVMNGLDATRQITSNYPEVRVIALSMHEESAMVRKMVAAGAKGYVLKNITREELKLAINLVSSGKTYYCTDVSKTFLNEETTGEDETAVLSDREKEILTLISEGLSNTEIGNRLHISPRTVDTHRQNIMKKTGVNSIAGLVKYAVRTGLAG